jgi:hypothetical protein
MPRESACEGSPCASMAAGKSSQQISIENGRSLAGMNPSGMSAREANATSMMLANSVRLLRWRGLNRMSGLYDTRSGLINKRLVAPRSDVAEFPFPSEVNGSAR